MPVLPLLCIQPSLVMHRYDDPDAEPVLLQRRRPKKAKLEDERSTPSTSGSKEPATQTLPQQGHTDVDMATTTG